MQRVASSAGRIAAGKTTEGVGPPRHSWRALVLPTFIALPFLPLLILLGFSAFTDPAYRLAPLVAVAAFLLGLRDLRLGSDTPPALGGQASWTARGLLIIAWGLLATASILAEPWLAAIGALAAIASFATGRRGFLGLRGVAPAIATVVPILPLPLELGGVLIRRLGLASTTLASRVLDLLAVTHARVDDVIRIPDEALRVQGATSGLQALFLVLGLVTFLTFWQRQSTILLLARAGAIIGWLFAVDILRVVLVVLIANRTGLDLANGRRGLALGIVSVLAAAILTLSTDRIFNAIRLTWRWLMIGPSRPTRRRFGDAFSADFADAREAVAWAASRIGMPADTPVVRDAVAWNRWAALAFVALLAAQPRAFAQARVRLAPQSPEPAWMLAASPEALPAAIGEFRREAVSADRPDEANLGGPRHSRLWIYRWGDRHVEIAARGPFRDRPDPADLAGSPWAVVRSETVPLETPQGLADVADLAAPAGRTAFAAASLAGADGQPLPAIGTRRHGWLDRLRDRAADRGAPPCYQIALLVRGGAALSPADRDEAIRFLDAARAALLRKGAPRGTAP